MISFVQFADKILKAEYGRAKEGRIHGEWKDSASIPLFRAYSAVIVAGSANLFTNIVLREE